MEEIRSLIENLTAATGLTGSLMRGATDIVLVLLTLLVSWLSFVVCHKVLVPMMLKITERTEMEWDDVLFNEKTLRSACMIIPAIVIWLFIPHIFYRHPDLEEVLERATAVYITITSMRLLLAFINSFKTFEGERRSAKQQYFHTFCGVLKIIIIFLSVIVMAAIVIGKSPLTLFAGLGATSAVLMLVFKDTISGLVAGVRLTSNDMLQKGDWITVSKAGVNGIVEDITLTTVKVRNFDNTIVTITPQTLVEDSFQNWKSMHEGGGRRVNRRVYFDFTTIRLADDRLKQSLIEKGYMTAEEMKGGVVNLTLFRRFVEKYLASREDVNTEMLFMVRQFEPTSTGLPVEFYFFVKNKAWKPYEHHAAEIMEYIYALVPEFGLGIYQRV